MKRIKLGLVANEFFDLSLGRMGGFGWATRQLARYCSSHPDLGIDLVFFTGELCGSVEQREIIVHHTRLILKQPSALTNLRLTRSERVDALLLIDYRPNYGRVCWALPLTPMIVWVRDPRPPEDIAKVSSLRIPGTNGVIPKGIVPLDCRSLGTITRASRLLGRPIVFASPEPQLRSKLACTIGVEIDECFLLPNPIEIEPGTIRKSKHPQVIFLARLDPYKRPWLFTELARRFPDVEFLLAGKAYHKGEGTWIPGDLPSNVRVLGHIDGLEKVRLLSSAWILVNTSIHEGLAVSFLEALACETPLLACVDPGGIVSRFGLHAGRFDGTGIEALPALSVGMNRLLSDPGLRLQLGQAGRRWVRETHNWANFLASFRDLCARIGVGE
jgi:glycosyltransferase involved in cell wall biosynthesis